jgi:DNA transposition AAA+ family ATPase
MKSDGITAHLAENGSPPPVGDLRPGQAPIQTSNVCRFKAFVKLLTDPHKAYPTMGVVTGPAGIGKTVSIEDYLYGLEPCSHTGLPAAIQVTVKPRSTPRALGISIATSLGERPRGSNIYEIADEAAEAILRNDTQLMFFDEADRLNEDSFDLTRHVFDRTGCPFVLVGLPSILSVIDRHEKFASRVGLRMSFVPLEQAEVLQVVLPSLVFPRWKFDPQDEADQAMGVCILKMVGSSLRKLCNLLQIASQIAIQDNASRITVEIIREAFHWSATPEDKRRLNKQDEADEAPPGNAASDNYEQASERRQAGKDRKKRKSQ